MSSWQFGSAAGCVNFHVGTFPLHTHFWPNLNLPARISDESRLNILGKKEEHSNLPRDVTKDGLRRISLFETQLGISQGT